jgi:hypothetical protein
MKIAIVVAVAVIHIGVCSGEWFPASNVTKIVLITLKSVAFRVGT